MDIQGLLDEKIIIITSLQNIIISDAQSLLMLLANGIKFSDKNV